MRALAVGCSRRLDCKSLHSLAFWLQRSIGVALRASVKVAFL